MDYSVSIYECNDCGYVGEYDSFLADPYVGEVFCPCEDCTGAGKWLKDREARFVGIAAYICDRAYGGPEEGGWYYDTGSVLPETIRCYEIGDVPAMMAYRDLLEMRGGGDRTYRVRTWIEKVPPAGFPSKKPVWC